MAGHSAGPHAGPHRSRNYSFSAITFVLSSIGSFIVSAHFNQSQARKEYEQLARPALRRVAAPEQVLALVASGVADRIARCQSDVHVHAEELIWLQGLTTQIQLLSHIIRDATSDRRELLPENYEDELQRAFDELGTTQASKDKLTSEIAQQKAKHAAGDKDANARIATLEAELAEQRRTAGSHLFRMEASPFDDYKPLVQFGGGERTPDWYKGSAPPQISQFDAGTPYKTSEGVTFNQPKKD